MCKKQFNGKKLREALIFRALNMTELANKTGISKQSISLYANNDNTPPYENVMKIASTLSFPFDFFMTDDSFSLSTSNTYFRSQASARKKNQQAQATRLEYLARMLEVLMDYVELPKLDLPSTDDFSTAVPDPQNTDAFAIADAIDSLAKKTREYWELGAGPIDNLKYLLEYHGVFVTYVHDIDNKIDAFSQKIRLADNSYMFIIGLSADGKSKTRLNFDMAHELGHILMHNWIDNCEPLNHDEFVNLEKQANMFASSFLLPKESFAEDVGIFPTKINYYIRLKEKWHTSIQAMIYRANQLKIISTNQYQYMMRTISAKGWRTVEPGDIAFALDETIFNSIVNLLINEGGLTGEDIVNAFHNHNIYLNRNEYEDLLGLKPGTLSVQNIKNNLIELKKRL